VQIAEKFG